MKSTRVMDDAMSGTAPTDSRVTVVDLEGGFRIAALTAWGRPIFFLYRGDQRLDYALQRRAGSLALN